jgi:hypothetical protein
MGRSDGAPITGHPREADPFWQQWLLVITNGFTELMIFEARPLRP